MRRILRDESDCAWWQNDGKAHAERREREPEGRRARSVPAGCVCPAFLAGELGASAFVNGTL